MKIRITCDGNKTQVKTDQAIIGRYITQAITQVDDTVDGTDVPLTNQTNIMRAKNFVDENEK